MLKIFVVEDDENIRELVLYALSSNGFEAAGFEDGHSFFYELKKKSNSPQLILLDIMLPDEDGMRILKKLRAEWQTCKIPIIMLTAKASEYDKVKSLDLGADDYITKPFSVLELLSRVKAVLRRTEGADKSTEAVEHMLTFGCIQLNIQRRTVDVDGTHVVLTYKEFELLQLLLQNAELVLTRDRMMEHVWGFDFESESRTVDMHIKTLRRKLGEGGKLIQTVRGIGYKMGERV